MSMNYELIIPPVIGLLSAVLVAVLNNWDKFNKDKKRMKEMLQTVTETKQKVDKMESKVDKLDSEIDNLQTAQRTGLQTQILEKCRRINIAMDKGDIDFSEELKQLIILYREYHLCGYNCQGKLYFNDTIAKASEHNNVLVRDLMNTYFSDYEP